MIILLLEIVAVFFIVVALVWLVAIGFTIGIMAWTPGAVKREVARTEGITGQEVTRSASYWVSWGWWR